MRFGGEAESGPSTSVRAHADQAAILQDYRPAMARLAPQLG
ncbi:MAG: hypothetical protein U5L06_08635 [Rhodovibrio sp.]|nr:hypothetical protein [Rhodovibrio sp.]